MGGTRGGVGIETKKAGSTFFFFPTLVKADRLQSQFVWVLPEFLSVSVRMFVNEISIISVDWIKQIACPK